MGLKFRSPIIKSPKNKALNNNGRLNAGFNSFLLGRGVPTWVNVQENHQLARIYSENPIVYAVITLKANLMSNGKVNIKDLNTGQLIKPQNLIDNPKDIKNIELVKKAFKLFDSPNVLQSRREFIMISSIFKDIFGNQFTFGNSGTSDVNIKTVAALWNIYPQYMNVLLAGNYLAATNLSEIVKRWEWGMEGIGRAFEPQEILHRKDPNAEIIENNDLIFGMSKLKPLKYPISNIVTAYESENVVLKNRGARLLITLARQQDQQGGIEAGSSTEKEQLQKDWKEYGLTEDQTQAFITAQPVSTTVIDQDIRKLGIFETIANDAMAVNNAYGMAHDLVKYWISGSTFENQSIAEKRTYEDTIIPEFDDWIVDINNWLRMEDFGLRYVPTFEHVGVLQEDQKEKSTANNITSKYHMDLFMKGAIVYNVWLQSVGLPEDPKIGEKRITDLTPEELQKIGISINTGGNNDN